VTPSREMSCVLAQNPSPIRGYYQGEDHALRTGSRGSEFGEP
jgi:hypothetical protein